MNGIRPRSCWKSGQQSYQEQRPEDAVTGFVTQGKKDRMEKIEINVIDDLDEVADADFILLGVKNFSLQKVAEAVKEKVGDKPIIVSMANGIENQRILPRIFSKVIYCVVCYNGWMDEPGVVGYQKRGPLAIGTPDLTRLAAGNGGVFPTEVVAMQIDGRAPLLAHGGEMPIFGPFLDSDLFVALPLESGQPMMTGLPLANVVVYLESIQTE